MYKLVTLLFFIGLILVLPLSAHAIGGDKTAQGFIKTSSGDDASGATVIVTCNSTTLTDTTGSNGLFQVTFTPAQCDRGDTVTINASLNGESATASKIVSEGPQVNFDIVTLSPIAVPEFGMIPGVIAALTSSIVFMNLRKKN